MATKKKTEEMETDLSKAVNVGAGLAMDKADLAVLAVGQADEPVFVLRPSRPGHIGALALIAALLPEEARNVQGLLREFELWIEAHK